MKLIIHGGLLETDDPFEIKQIRLSLQDIARKAHDFLKEHTALETVVYAVELLENDPLFDAGTGSEFQADGVIRMSSAVCDGANLVMGAVINIQDVQNPVRVAERLLDEKYKALAGNEALWFAREKGFEYYNAETERRRREFEQGKKPSGHGTVGCVALDANGNIAAATSTGGTGAELPGRVSDSATVAGNYANAFCGVSCSGTGEDIINSALAAKIVTRVTDGKTLAEAFALSFNEIKEVNGDAAAIGISSDGKIFQSFSKAKISYAAHNGKGIKTFQDDEADCVCIQ